MFRFGNGCLRKTVRNLSSVCYLALRKTYWKPILKKAHECKSSAREWNWPGRAFLWEFWILWYNLTKSNSSSDRGRWQYFLKIKNMMFFSDPQFDLKISLYLFAFSVLVGLIVLGKTKNKFLATMVFSILGNLSFLINMWSRMFISYDLEWLQIFSLLIWPIINIALLIKYFSKSDRGAVAIIF